MVNHTGIIHNIRELGQKICKKIQRPPSNSMEIEQNQQFIECYDKYSDAIFRHCYFRLFDRELAVDMMQETFLKTWEYLAEGHKVDNLRAFLYRVATNLIIDYSRRRKEMSLEMLQDEGFEPSFREQDRIDSNLEIQRILECLRQLEPQYQEVVLMRYIEDLSPQEIAAILGESENVVSVRIHRGIKKLREVLGEKINEPKR